MSQTATYNSQASDTEAISRGNKKADKYHHAAYTYLIVGIIYLLVFYFTMPSHDFPAIIEELVTDYMSGPGSYLNETAYIIIVNVLAIGAGIIFIGLSFFIYKEYRTLTMILAVFYAIRFMIATAALFSDGAFATVKYVLPLIAITFYMLARAAWDLKP